MKIITALRIIAVASILTLFTGCAGEPDFLKKFTGASVKKKLYTEKIIHQDLNILMATNEVNGPVFNVDHTYYYGFYKKLEHGHYLVSYRDSNSPAYRFTNSLIGWNDIYYCIYNSTNNSIVSKLKVQSTDPVLSNFEEKDGIYTIKSRYFKFIPKEGPCNTIVIQKDSAISKYRIKDNRFVQL